MSLSGLDLVAALIALVYAVLGLQSGLIRRVIGFLGLFVAFGAATYLSPEGGSFIQQGAHNGMNPNDARIYAFFGFLVLVIIVIEGLSGAYHGLLQFSFVPLDRITGLILGIITGVVLATLVVYVLIGAGTPTPGPSSPFQDSIRTTVDTSAVKGLVARDGGPIERLFSPVLPTDPSRFFSIAVRG